MEEERQTDRHKTFPDKQANRQTDKQANTQIDKERNR